MFKISDSKPHNELMAHVIIDKPRQVQVSTTNTGLTGIERRPESLDTWWLSSASIAQYARCQIHSPQTDESLHTVPETFSLKYSISKVELREIFMMRIHDHLV